MFLLLILSLQINTSLQALNYGNARSRCATWKCKREKFPERIPRELCIQKCIEPVCFEQVYADMIDIQSFNSQQEEDIIIEEHKNQFKMCISEGNFKQTSYTEKRAACATYNKECKEIPQDQVIERALCQHKCMSAKCY